MFDKFHAFFLEIFSIWALPSGRAAKFIPTNVGRLRTNWLIKPLA